MPLLYAEGERTFLRLQEKIMKVSYNQSIFAWEEVVEGARTLWHSEGASESFGMTNGGLNLRLPLVEMRDEKGNVLHRAVLGCRYEDNLAGPIGLNLDAVTRFGAYPLARRGPKLAVVPLEDVATATYTSVSIHDLNPRV